jgi:hypothetical protein
MIHSVPYSKLQKAADMPKLVWIFWFANYGFIGFQALKQGLKEAKWKK